jgi:hypothetical protein
MVTIGFKIPAGALEACRRQIEEKLSRVVVDVAAKTYNNILHQEFPYYSGAYISSWRISVGSPDRSFNEPLWQRGVYLAPREVRGLSIASAYQPVYISNYAPHAGKVEYEGTPKHSDGWYIATAAKNNTILSYKFF